MRPLCRSPFTLEPEGAKEGSDDANSANNKSHPTETLCLLAQSFLGLVKIQNPS